MNILGSGQREGHHSEVSSNHRKVGMGVLEQTDRMEAADRARDAYSEDVAATTLLGTRSRVRP